MGRKTSYGEAIQLLITLKAEYPNYSLGQHLSTALGDYGDLWGVTDKEIVFALEKYKTELESNIVSDTEVERIVRDAENLNKLFEEEDYD